MRKRRIGKDERGRKSAVEVRKIASFVGRKRHTFKSLPSEQSTRGEDKDVGWITSAT